MRPATSAHRRLNLQLEQLDALTGRRESVEAHDTTLSKRPMRQRPRPAYVTRQAALTATATMDCAWEAGARDASPTCPTWPGGSAGACSTPTERNRGGGCVDPARSRVGARRNHLVSGFELLRLTRSNRPNGGVDRNRCGRCDVRSRYRPLVRTTTARRAAALRRGAAGGGRRSITLVLGSNRSRAGRLARLARPVVVPATTRGQGMARPSCRRPSDSRMTHPHPGRSGARSSRKPA